MMSISQNPAQMTAQIYYPVGTVRCEGPALFRNQLARDFACLLDVDDAVTSWSCLPAYPAVQGDIGQSDFMVIRHDGQTIVDVENDAPVAPRWTPDEAQTFGFTYQIVTRSDLPLIRMKNARDLLRYARFETSLSDRIRILAALDEHGSLSIAECLPAFQCTLPIAALSSLILQRFVQVDLDEAVIGPETQVRRHRD